MDWEQIWHQHWQEIYRYIFFRVRDRHEAEDLTQETFMRAMKTKPRKNDSIQPLLKTIARNLIIDRWRKNRGNLLQSLEQQEAQGVNFRDATEAFASFEQQDELFRALQSLTLEQQQVVRYRLINDLSVNETAERMGKSPGAIKTLLYRALLAIRESIKLMNNNGEDISHEK